MEKKMNSARCMWSMTLSHNIYSSHNLIKFKLERNKLKKILHVNLCAVLSCVQLFVIAWTVAQGPLCPWNFPGKNTGVGCHFEGIFLTQRLNLHFTSPALVGRFFITAPPGNPNTILLKIKC